MTFVPDDFEVPLSLDGPGFRLVPLTAAHNEQDFAAWHGSVEHIQGTPGFEGRDWPVHEFTLERNHGDLVGHENDFAARTGFTYTVLSSSSGDVIGCVYVYPPQREGVDVDVRSWVRADHAELDKPLHDAVVAWLEADWPFTSLDYAPR